MLRYDVPMSLPAFASIPASLDALATPDTGFWPLVTGFGDGLMLFPVALLFAAWLARRAEGRPLARRWLVLLIGAIVLTSLSKLAFIGWGLGVASLDFTGISGHAMFASAVYPLLAAALAGPADRRRQFAAAAAAYGLAVLVAVSRVMLDLHSVSEAVAGVLVGGTASALALLATRPPRSRAPLLLLPFALASWFWLTPAQELTHSRSHGVVTDLALALSGRPTPYTRNDMLRDWRLGKHAPLQALMR